LQYRRIRLMRRGRGVLERSDARLPARQGYLARDSIK
jgi:hypothetical protein